MTTMPLANASLDRLFEIEKDFLGKKAGTQIRFHVLKKSLTEVVYYYVDPFSRKPFLLNGIVRTFVNEKGYYSIHYKIGLQGEIPLESVLYWKEKLENVNVSS